jgi:hypothetical protein
MVEGGSLPRCGADGPWMGRHAEARLSWVEREWQVSRKPDHENAPCVVHDWADDGGHSRRGDLFRPVRLDGKAVGTIPSVVDRSYKQSRGDQLTETFSA